MLKFELTNMKPLLLQGFFLCLISLAFCWISLPGLSGGFILDDFPNLDKLNQIRDVPTALQFILNGISSELGRPISLLSFALQAEHWPANPFSFKIVNLCIQLANAWLVYLCCYQIAKIKAWPERSGLIFSGTVFGLWLFHPLNISTTFYVVQRMTLLAALFSLVGVAAFLWGVRLSIANELKKGLTVATIGIGITYLLGILSKENAVLTGLGISALYWLLIRPQYISSLWDKWIVICGILPSIILFTYLCFNLDHYARSDFTAYQRLLTESVILLDYLNKILFPTPFKLNVYNDGFPLYKEFFSSFIVLVAVALWLSLITISICLRKRLPFFAFAVFWFLSGHLLESSIFGLELYFEHRNYLPSLGVIIGIVGSVVDLSKKSQFYSALSQKIIRYSGIALISTMSIWNLMVYGAEASSWKNPGSMAIAAIAERPNSMRAHQNAASFFANTGNIKAAAYILDTIEKRWPSTGSYAQYLMLKCIDEDTKIPEQENILRSFQSGAFDRGTLPAMADVYTLKEKGNCQFISWEKYLEDVEALFNNPAFGSQKDDFLILQAYIYKELKQPEKAALALDRLPNEQATIDFLLYKTQFFAVAGNTDQSLKVLEFIKTKYAGNLKYKITNEKMVISLETMIKQAQLDKTKVKSQK
jgi:protein O-mannosyl-transferase